MYPVPKSSVCPGGTLGTAGDTVVFVLAGLPVTFVLAGVPVVFAPFVLACCGETPGWLAEYPVAALYALQKVLL